MSNSQENIQDQGREVQENGLPGGGKGRKDEVGKSGVYPLSASDEAPGDATIVSEPAWGQGERGAEGYNDSGSSGLTNLENEPSKSDAE